MLKILTIFIYSFNFDIIISVTMKKLLLIFLIFSVHHFSFSQVLFHESFDSTAIPCAWKNIQVSGAGYKSVWDDITIGTNAICNPHSGTGMARYFCYNLSEGKSAILISPSINLTTVGVYVAKVSFWMFRDNSYPTKEDSLDIYVNDTLTLSNAVHLGKLIRYKGLPPIQSTTGWYQYSFEIPTSFSGDKNYIILKATSEFGYDIIIDDLSVYIDNAVNIDVTEENASINIFPNPSDGITNIETKQISNAELSVYSLMGQKVFSKKINTTNTVQQLDFSFLVKGTYIIQIKNEKNNIIRKLVIQ